MNWLFIACIAGVIALAAMVGLANLDGRDVDVMLAHDALRAGGVVRSTSAVIGRSMKADHAGRR